MYHYKTIAAAALLIAMPFVAFAQFTISGKVKNKVTNELIAGATIKIDNTYTAAQSKGDGTFEINNLKSGTYIIHASFIGFQKVTDTINLTENKTINFELTENTVLMDAIVVSSTRADEKSAMAYSTVTKDQLAEQNLGQDLPYLLDQLPSVVTTSDAGTGVGYTYMRIRGSDAERINVTIDGIPINDAEDQGMYWVDLPDMASSIDNIQIQRGVGTSTNGEGAFGGSLNIQTTKLNATPYGEYNTSYGSFNTFKNTVNVGSGLIDNKFTFDARLSDITSDGYIDRGTSNLKSYYLSGGYYGKKTIIKFITFTGYEQTYQAWNGIPEARLNGDVAGMNAYINQNGLDAQDAANLLNSGSRTYNQFTYPNQYDNYIQNYYMLHLSHQFNSHWNANIALHYTKGKGYYEEYKKNEPFSSYGLNNVIIGTDTITSTNLVRRLWLNNDFFGTTFSINYNSFKKFSITIGGAANDYYGLHYDEIIWAQYASNSVLHTNYASDTANKKDFNIYVKANYLIAEKLNVFVDLQYRTINYSFLGFNDSLKNVQQDVMLNFFNPKVGLNYDLTTNANVYASYSVGNKEPNRNDYTQSTPTNRPKPENLNDLEVGYKQKTKRIFWGLNLYYMKYKNQLVNTGQINDVGAYIDSNVPDSYREGVEAEIGARIFKQLTWNANATFSQNKIKNYVEYVDNYDSTAQRVNHYKLTDIDFSPDVIAANTFTFEPVKHLKFSFISKYVSKQYLDNTSHEDRKLNPYFVNNFRINYSFKTKYIREIGITLLINNIFNEKYESNGYTYESISGGQFITSNYYFPQAGTNFLVGLSFKF